MPFHFPFFLLNDRSTIICIISRRSLFFLRALPDAIPPFLPISRSSSGLRSVFGIRFDSFTIQPPLVVRSGFVRGSISDFSHSLLRLFLTSFMVRFSISPFIRSLRLLLFPTLHFRRQKPDNSVQLLLVCIWYLNLYAHIYPLSSIVPHLTLPHLSGKDSFYILLICSGSIAAHRSTVLF